MFFRKEVLLFVFLGDLNSPVDDLFENLIKNYKVRPQISLTVRGTLIYK